MTYTIVITRDGDRWLGDVWDGERLLPVRRCGPGAATFHGAVGTCQRRARDDAAARAVLIEIGAMCRVCGCTDDDCSGCVERTGQPCWWVEPGLCSACAGESYARAA